MRVLPGLLLGAGFVLGMALMVLFVILLRSSLLHLIKPQGGRSIPESGPYAGIGQNEQIKRPAFLYSIQN
jgi:hypothetical protein